MSKSVKTISGVFDHHTALALRKAFNKATADNKETFSYGGQTYLTTYAKYLLEFLVNEGVLNNA